MLLENGEDVLEEVELLVACRSPEIVAMNNERLLLLVTGFVHYSDTTLFPERRISKDHFILAMLCAERILYRDRYRGISISANPMQQHIHSA
jgi:hypothetical protein